MNPERLPWPAHSRFPREEADLARHFMTVAQQSVPPAVLFLPLLALMMTGHAEGWRVWSWVALFLVIECLLYRRVLRSQRECVTPLDVFKHYPDVRTLMLACGLAWGGAMWFLYPSQASDPYRILLVAWLAGAFSLSCLILAPCRELHRPFFLAYWSYPLLALMTSPDRLDQMVLLGLGLFVLSQWRFVERYRGILFDTVRLKQLNQGMMDELVDMHVQAAIKREELETMRVALTAALERQQRLLECDAPPGCYTPRALRRRLDEAAAHSLSAGARWSLAMFDLDHFKRVNDAFGHQAGDEVLRELVEFLSSLLPPGCSLFRYGGEEFVVLAPGLSEQQLAGQMSEIRQAAAQHVWPGVPADYPVTLSAGVTACRPGDPVKQCLKQADDALYMAKRLGRNRVCLASTLGMMPKE